ncbi:GtrA family protein [Sphingobium chlorophenolicum]|uniref:GtrA-like protein n=1 Tax=Sphingobium chlorophenolicum TaxID=46429 RepID=A0A081RGN2_SPHCR|nr:GtrA family protein [Sphingobium chlorophenolicum]KEQ54355.1 GtrA-like protein [Sphingobium chlorophenolicum]
MITPPIDRRFIGFLIAGGINTLFGYCTFGGLVLIGMSPHVALIVSTVAGILFNFLTASAVFRSRDPRRLPPFLLVYAFILGLNMLLLDLGMRAGLGPLLAQALILPIFTLTFLAMRRFVFGASPEKTS